MSYSFAWAEVKELRRLHKETRTNAQGLFILDTVYIYFPLVANLICEGLLPGADGARLGGVREGVSKVDLGYEVTYD